MTGVELGEGAQVVEVRIRLRVAGDELLGQWATLPPEQAKLDDDDLRDAVTRSLSRSIRTGGTTRVDLADRVRWVSGRHVEWFEVEVRRRRA